MTPEPSSGGMQVTRIFEQPPDAISLYSDLTQILGTGHEVVLQFYETIPGTPGPGGQIQMVRSRLRATITVSMAHAANIGRLLIKHSGAESSQPEAAKEGEGQS
jgi:hypothetical protein